MTTGGGCALVLVCAGWCWLGACAGDHPRAGDGARAGADSAGSAGAGRRAAGGSAGESAAGTEDAGSAAGPGSLRVEVSWPEAGAGLRAPAGRGPCGKSRRAPVVIHTLGGVADAVVELRAPAGLEVPPDSADSEAPRIFTVTACGPEPRVIATRVPGDSFVACNHDEARRTVAAWPVAGSGGEAASRSVFLAVAGACSVLPVDRAGVFRVTADVDPDEPAYAFASGSARVAVTDERGMAVFRDLPAGEYEVRVWLPPAGGEAALQRTRAVRVRAGRSEDVRVHMVEP